MAGYLFAWLSVNLLDLVTTLIGFKQGIPEGNPLPALILARGDLGLFIAYKLAMTLAFPVAVLLLSRRHRRIWFALPLATTIALIVVELNIVQISR